MQLVGFSSNGNRVHFVRDLTEEEIAKDKKYTAIFTEARGRFHLFKILSLNYADWTANINLLLNPQSKIQENEILQLDRLLLNYLLAPIVQEFHHRMLESYGGYVAKLFYPDLFPAAQFYLELTNEVKKHGADFRMFFTNAPDVKTAGDKQTMNLTFSFVPNDLFAELGISVSAKTN